MNGAGERGEMVLRLKNRHQQLYRPSQSYKAHAVSSAVKYIALPTDSTVPPLLLLSLIILYKNFDKIAGLSKKNMST